ncbi:hypothetical protein F4604DRAFT_1681533 [Suillus subluteus]|nr:hypothetical protein F4604DRAFT_1681533 [Suillus subluteus]
MADKSLKCPCPIQSANSESDSDTHCPNDVVPSTPSATSEPLQVNTDMPQDEPRAKCPCLRQWASIQLESSRKKMPSTCNGPGREGRWKRNNFDGILAIHVRSCRGDGWIPSITY